MVGLVHGLRRGVMTCLELSERLKYVRDRDLLDIGTA